MFSLEKSLREWRRPLSADPSIEEGYIEELESHLRDKIEDLIGSGRTPEEAFNEAIRALGEAGMIGSEFYKVYTTRRTGRPSWQAPRFVPALAWNTFKVAVRLIRRNKLLSLMNIAGLSVGLACFILFFLSWRYEHSFDRIGPDADRIFRVERTSGEFGTTETRPSTQAPLAQAIVKNLPEVAQAGRIQAFHKSVISLGDRSVIESRAAALDPEAAELLHLKILAGRGPEALREPGRCLLSERAARAYFGGESPLGKSLKISVSWGLNRTRAFEFSVSGLVRDQPSNVTYVYDVFLPIATLSALLDDPSHHFDYLSDWGQPVFLTLVLLKPGTDVSALEKKITALVKNDGPWEAGVHTLNPLVSVHTSDPGLKKYLFLFGSIALLVLLLAGINTVTLSTARAVRRLKEVGVRKLAGAGRARLVGQFLGESVVAAFLALILALASIQLFLPAFRWITGRGLRLEEILDAGLLASVAGIALLVGLAAGAYPAFRLSRIEPIELFQRTRTETTSRSRLRQGLVFIQFTILGVFMAATLAVSRQVSFIERANMGMDRENILVIRLNEARFISADFQNQIRHKLGEIPAVRTMAFSFAIPPDVGVDIPVRLEKAPEREAMLWTEISGDRNLLDVFSLRLVEGANFGPVGPPGSIRDCLINETAARSLGPGPVIGTILRQNVHGEVFVLFRVAGVVKDFNHRTLHHPIAPLLIESTDVGMLLAVKLDPAGGIKGTMEAIESVWKSVSQGLPLDAYFLDEAFSRAYLAEARLSRLVRIFAGLALFIASLGVLGLVSFSVEQRRREAGIRKVLGASWKDLAAMFLRDLGQPVILSNLLAWPAGYWLVRTWLQDFAFKTDVPAWLYLVGSGVAMGLALLTAGYVIVQAARRNPVEVLRNA